MENRLELGLWGMESYLKAGQRYRSQTSRSVAVAGQRHTGSQDASSDSNDRIFLIVLNILVLSALIAYYFLLTMHVTRCVIDYSRTGEEER